MVHCIQVVDVRAVSACCQSKANIHGVVSIWLHCKGQLIFAARVHDSELINAHDCERSYHL